MKIWKDFGKPIVVLGVICLVTSLLLAVTNDVTAPIIEASAIRAANETRQALLPTAESFSEVTIPDAAANENVTEAYKASNGAGYVITARAKGYGGYVPVMVAFGEEGNIAAVKFLDNSETPGLGQKVKSDGFQGQFAGMEAEPFGMGDIEVLSGATFSSRAAVEAVNAAIDVYQSIEHSGEGA